MELNRLEVYKISREISKTAWNVYREMGNDVKFSIGQQFIRAVDSVGANIAEGYGRYHYLDSVKFYYNARGSLWESKHWVELLYERHFISGETYSQVSERLNTLGVKLNNFISSVKNRATNNHK
ncbi:MAG: four helix bundle protein [Deltaproteobacteria bacterium]|nr:four helix bundle protein [Deltaproteobacteria bacterium]